MTLGRGAGVETSYSRRPGIPPRVIIGLVIAAISLFSYFASSSYNPITDQKQHVSISKEQEIALGLQAKPSMERQYGGESRDPRKQALVKEVGTEVVNKSDASKTDYRYDFHLLADPITINAFALPGGQVFITEGLFKHLKTRGQLASVLSHEVGHVAARHSAQHLAKQRLTQGLTGATVIATYDPDNPSSRASAQVAMMVGQLVNLKFNRNDELEADKLGVRFAVDAGYDPRSMIKVMEILRDQSRSRQPEFFSTHPNPENRIEKINAAIKEEFPQGVPQGLQQ
ncbi:MAG TPA: M48 family peptidase [Candidatus Melainabacteria bacterium]|nr:M48 family peptidase [Candidatus Melainabacteria bacterium]HIN67016.1 M48 family peptidase [Candidatus Obscuribacterales bacterium]